MCIVIFGVFAALCVSAYIDGNILHAVGYGVIAAAFGALFGYRIYANKEYIFKKSKSDGD